MKYKFVHLHIFNLLVSCRQKAYIHTKVNNFEDFFLNPDISIVHNISTTIQCSVELTIH